MLTPKAKDKILKDPQLMADIAIATGRTPYATVMMVRRNQSKELASVYVVRAISKRTGLSEDKIIGKKQVA